MRLIILSLACCLALTSCKRAATDKTNATFIQEGVTEVRGIGPIEVFYPVPFRGTPNLTFPKREFVNFGNPIEQRPDGFRVKIDSFGPAAPAKFQWKAEGIRANSQ